MSDERKRENEEEKLKDFFHNVIGIKSEAVLEVLAENSEICKLKAKTLLMKENEKVDAISFLYKKPPRLPVTETGAVHLRYGFLFALFKRSHDHLRGFLIAA